MAFVRRTLTGEKATEIVAHYLKTSGHAYFKVASAVQKGHFWIIEVDVGVFYPEKIRIRIDKNEGHIQSVQQIESRVKI